MPFFLKFKNYFIALGVFLLLVVLYYAFRNTAATDKTDIPECPATFTIHPGGLLAGYVGTTYSTLDGKYFKQISGGAVGASGTLPKQEITKEDFLAACKTYQIPNQQ